MLKLAVNTTACDGSDVFFPWLLWLLGAFLLGLLLGWLLKQLFGCGNDDKVVPVAAAIDEVKDDLTKVEGIGPKIKGLLNNDGIWSFKQLSLASTARLQKILDDAGPAYTVHNPRTWAAQAKLADEENWEELKIWQDHLKGGL
ncbi:MAG: hypothetical protein DSY82_04030 [Flavobacteriia bacterium]|nr:MAG: hypothetical protein DSY82_04030 [Flavobacteriia bacterium]